MNALVLGIDYLVCGILKLYYRKISISSTTVLPALKKNSFIVKLLLTLSFRTRAKNVLSSLHKLRNSSGSDKDQLRYLSHKLLQLVHDQGEVWIYFILFGNCWWNHKISNKYYFIIEAYNLAGLQISCFKRSCYVSKLN